MPALRFTVLFIIVALAAGARAGVDYAIVVTGGELLAGSYPDAHTHFITRSLFPLGLHCVSSVTVDDRAADIHEALRFAGQKTKLIIVTGGLGPTDNDITRQTLSAFTGIELREEPAVIEGMEKRLKIGRDAIRPTIRRQALVPGRGTYLKAANGTAVGLVFEMGEKVIVALPGPPRELQPMVRDELIPWLSKRFGTSLPGASLTLRFVGLGQSQISQTMAEHVKLPAGAILGSAFDGSRVDFTFTMPDDTPEARAKLQDIKAQIVKHLGESVYGEGDATLEECIIGRLAGQGITLAIAEAGSGGALAAALNSAEGADRVIAGAFAAPSEEKLRQLLKIADTKWPTGASAADRASMLASAVAESTGAKWAIAVGPVTRAGDAAAVQVAFHLPDGRSFVRPLPLRGAGEPARASLTTQILDLLRRQSN